MPETVFKDPKLALNRIYTRAGDHGETRLVNGRKVTKDDPKIAAYGTVDELICHMGAARLLAEELSNENASLRELAGILTRVQHELFNLGSLLATDPAEVRPQQPRVREADIRQLESEIDRMNANLPTLPSFVLPGGHRLNTELHLCRTVCRRAERLAVALGKREEVPEEVFGYLNRLSDALFVWSRWVCLELGVAETLWQPNKSASGGQ